MESNQLWGMCWMSIHKGKEDKWPLNVTGQKQFTRVCESHILSEADGLFHLCSYQRCTGLQILAFPSPRENHCVLWKEDAYYVLTLSLIFTFKWRFKQIARELLEAATNRKKKSPFPILSTSSVCHPVGKQE